MSVIKLALYALGGQGGGVFTGWVEAVARANGYVAQATSVAGVSQRTGATVYYIEMAPVGPDAPVFSLMPAAGDVDVMVTAEMMEAGRSIMRGFAFRNAPGWGFAGNSEIKDFVGAAKWLKQHKDVDAAKGIGMYGLSWGGYMTAAALAMHSDLFTVGFDMAGVHFTGDAKGMAHTPIGMIEGWKSPIFLAQGDDDMNVNFNDGIALSQALQLAKPDVEFKQQALPGQTHDLYLTFEQLVQIYTDGSDWLISHLNRK